MPELPEVEVVRRGLADHILGARITGVEVKDGRSLRRHEAGPVNFQALLSGLTVLDVARRGKYLWLHFAGVEDLALVIHLGMSGQVLLKDPGLPVERHQKIVFHLEGASNERGEPSPLELRFVDQRIFGGMFVSPLVPVLGADGSPQPGAGASSLGLPYIPQAVAHIARDPLDPYFDYKTLRRTMLGTSTGIKKLLLDQGAISGVGNIYADEALWRAKLHYAKPAKTIPAPTARALIDAAREVMCDALAEGGTSFDALYVNVNGESGYFDRSLQAYGQAGRPCPRCLTAGRTSLIIREPFGGRSSYRCPHCQRKPRGL
ncbi:bifunctional DNA-formamidopyrimidine glycosylase/DNA-(apurinic or apyrimidinic site) lyase [Rothia nasimurium]|uniref:bifunctional DNA-formamidopyrimidine glycosylase/DNA-(apurinic or apyrimidinic site) lyase n=1 Tax=Rothia nasimurium TaxID=85336 RepID=UPI001EFF7144|nr:bifunctional DNA-formamidopyrimidine glycosylase/DNA-(apurinic or apyrimidinic site) lyase [Rothia nasimurium]